MICLTFALICCLVFVCSSQSLHERVSSFFDSMGCIPGTNCANEAARVCSWTEDMLKGISEM